MSEETAAAPGRNVTVALREINKDTLRAILDLKVTPNQEHFVAPNAVSIAQAHFDPETAWFRAIYADDAPVGFVMLSDDTKKQEYYLWRFMIDARYQGLGYGGRALALLVDYVKTRPGFALLYTSCVPGEESPCPFYEKMGFVATCEMEDDEAVMRMELGGA